jgi:hypothetical protein
MTFFDIVLRTEASLHPDGEPDDFISEHTGVLRCSGEDNVVRRVGRVRAATTACRWRGRRRRWPTYYDRRGNPTSFPSCSVDY